MPEVARPTTESVLRDWWEGAGKAERLAAAVLRLDGFTDIDPQAPLGGPDGGKDILCVKDFREYVGAVYFPNGQKTFAELRGKFKKDLESAKRHERARLVFVTNQAITVQGRGTLKRIADHAGVAADLCHRESICNLLDSPAGYGVRVQFLNIPMNESEQFAYFASSGNKLESALERQAKALHDLARGQEYVVQTMYWMTAGDEVSPPPNLAATAQIDQRKTETIAGPLSGALTPSLLLFVHRIVGTDLPPGIVGKFRDRVAWIGAPGTTQQEAALVPPPPDEISEGLHEILAKWNQAFSELQSAKPMEKLEAVARFHHRLVALHPFTDGNGRVARALLAQQCVDLFGGIDLELLDSGADYYKALREATQGEFGLLQELVGRAVTRQK